MINFKFYYSIKMDNKTLHKNSHKYQKLDNNEMKINIFNMMIFN